MNQKKKSFSLWVSNALVILSVWFKSDFDAYICRHLRQLIEGHSLGAWKCVWASSKRGNGIFTFWNVLWCPQCRRKKSKTRNSRPTFALAYLHLMFVLWSCVSFAYARLSDSENKAHALWGRGRLPIVQLAFKVNNFHCSYKFWHFHNFFYKLTVSKDIGRKFRANIHLLAFVMTLRQNHLSRLLKHS